MVSSRRVKANLDTLITLALFQSSWLLLFDSTVKKMQQADLFHLSLLREIIFLNLLDIIIYFLKFVSV